MRPFLDDAAPVGQVRECRRGPAHLSEATDWIEDYRRVWEARLDRLGDFVEQSEMGGS